MVRTGAAGDRPMFSRDELLGGLPARRASTILYAIESRTAALVRANRVDRAAYVGERTVVEREQAFLGALAAGREAAPSVTIQALERHAGSWAELVPPGTDVRAAVARLLGAKYRLPATLVPGIRRALTLDDPGVDEAFARLHGAPLASAFTPQLDRRERFRWARAGIARRFEELPPFWIAYFLALTETIGEGILILPVALAAIGPIPAAVLLLVLGLANLVTLGAMAEAVTRNGSMRYGTAYFGRLVEELLGGWASRAQSTALGVFNVVVLFAYLLGFASVFTGATGIPEGIWVALLFAINVFFLRHETLDDTIASAVVIGIVNLVLVAVITSLAATHIDPVNLAFADVPLLNGRPPDVATVGLVFGVVLVAFFGHTSVANASKLILTRDPGGRSLLWGNVAALATVIALYAVMVVAIGGAVGPGPLSGTRGTAITPLAAVVGPVVNVLGSIYVVLALGIGSIYVTLGIYNQVLEVARGTRAGGGGRLGRITADRRGRLALGLAPAAAVFVLLEVVLLLDADWFAGPIGYVGVLAVPLVGGIFPMLLVAAARRRGENVPERVVRVIGHPVTVVVVIALLLTGVVLHGLVIWDVPPARVAALVVATLTIALLAWLLSRRAFRRRLVVEIREDEARRRTLTVTDSGRAVIRGEPVVTPARGATTDLTVTLPPGTRGDVRVWAHAVTLDGWSVPLALRVAAGIGGSSFAADTPAAAAAATDGTAELIVDGPSDTLRITVGGSGAE